MSAALLWFGGRSRGRAKLDHDQPPHGIFSGALVVEREVVRRPLALALVDRRRACSRHRILMLEHSAHLQRGICDRKPHTAHRTRTQQDDIHQAS
jgi:hypothetical protein